MRYRFRRIKPINPDSKWFGHAAYYIANGISLINVIALIISVLFNIKWAVIASAIITLLAVAYIRQIGG